MSIQELALEVQHEPKVLELDSVMIFCYLVDFLFQPDKGLLQSVNVQVQRLFSERFYLTPHLKKLCIEHLVGHCGQLILPKVGLF